MIKTHPSRRTIFAAIVICFILIMGSTPLFVGATAVPSGIGFHVAVDIPENQIDLSKSYFDLRMEPKQIQQLTATVRSSSDVPITLDISLNNAYTNPIGSVEYMHAGIRDSSLKHALEDIASLSHTEIELAPGEEKQITITLEMPEEVYDGQILGGVVFTKRLPEGYEAEPGVSLVNVYSYTVGMLLTETDNPVLPEIHLLDVQPDLVNHRTAVVHSLQNSTPLLLKGAFIHIEIFQQGEQKPLWTKTQEDVRMAPSSLMEYLFYLDEQEIVAGDYLSKVHMEWEDQSWDFEQRFSIEREQASFINDNSVTLTNQTPILPAWALISIAICLLILLILLVYLVVALVKKNKLENDKPESKKSGNDKPESKKSESDKPENKKSKSKKPESKKSKNKNTNKTNSKGGSE